MPITLITGTPGAGKTLFAVKKLLEEVLPTGRPVYTNIAGFSAPQFPNLHVIGDEGPREWINYPDGAFCVFDEVQRQYPFKNSMTKNPDYITGYETHRHRGMDFIFITQGPYLIDRHLHPLIDRHYHVYRPFGFRRSTLLEWQGVNPNPAPLQSRANAAVKNFTFPKKYFSHYKSATQHTVKVRFPWKLAAIFAAILGLCAFAVYRGYSALSSDLIAGGGADMVEAVGQDGQPVEVCASVLARSPKVSVLRIGSRVYRLQSDAVVLSNTEVAIDGRSDLAWPRCRVTG